MGFCIEALEQRQLLAVVSVNQSALNQTIRAMGANFAKIARNSGAPISDNNLKFLVDNLKPSHGRVPINIMAWEPKADNANPNVINWAGFKDQGRLHEQFLQLQDFNARGIWLTASVFDAPDWLVDNPDAIKSRNVPVDKMPFLAESIGAWLIRARDTYGVKIDTVSINESNAGYNLRFPISVTKTFMNIAGPMFETMGLGYVKWLIGDDGFVGTGTFVKPALQDATMRPYLGDIGWHSWNLDNFDDSNFFDLRRTAQQYGKEIWSTEQGYDPLLYTQNPSAFYTWDHAREMSKIYLRTLRVVQATVLDYWQYGDDFPLLSPLKKPLPTYYVLKPLYDNLTPGTQMIYAGSDTPSVLAMAAKNQKENRFFLQAINDDQVLEQTVTFTGLPNRSLTWMRSSPTEDGAIVGTVTPVKGSLTLTIPANSVNSFSGTLYTPGGNAPKASIVSASTASSYRSGADFKFAGSATDTEEGSLPASAYRWEISLYHSGKFEDPLVFNAVKSSKFKTPLSFQRETDQFYRIKLTVQDSTGKQSIVTRDVKPKLANITMKTNVAGLFVRLDGLSEIGNTVVRMVQGTHRLEAPLYQTLNGKIYRFSKWSDAGAKAHTINNGGDVSYTATYTDATKSSTAPKFLAPSDDATVADGALGDTNYGNDPALTVKTSGDVGKSRITYMKFDLGSFASSIAGAELRLTGSYGGADLVDTAIYPVADVSWSESAITWNSRPTYDPALPLGANQLGDAKTRIYSWDLTAYLAAQKTAGATSVSFAIAQPVNGSTETFASSEASTGIPQLILTRGA
jgi:hypothetical protein